MARRYDNRLAAPGPRPAHLAFSIEGRWLLYCYIQKNACSAMKRVLLASNNRNPDDWRGEFDFEPFRYRFESEAASSAFDCRFFIYRDPIDRMASLFVNKFIQRIDNVDLFSHYVASTGGAAGSATFEAFVCNYVVHDEANTDSHCHSQHSRLWPIQYTHAIPMMSLFDEMSELAGVDFARRFFKDKTNAITAARYDEPSHRLSADMLHDRYLSSSKLPSARALVTDRLREVLRRRFADDYRMISEIEYPLRQFVVTSARRLANKFADVRKRVANIGDRSQ